MSAGLPVSDDPFEVMGVAKDVGEKDLKKRYFQLLRQFPPETHPEEFNRVQHAYDVLKDPQARAALDQKAPYEDVPEPYRTRLRDALAQLQSGQVDLARTALKAMVEENGELDDPRKLLEQVYFSEGKFAEAEAQVAVLVKRNPTASWLLYRHALVLSRLERHADAAAAAEQWLKVSDGKDALAWEFIAEALAGQKKHAEAYRRLEEGLARVTVKVPLMLTRMHLRLDQLDKAGLERDVAELVPEVKRSDDETRQGAVQRLQSLAALYFGKNLTDEANLLLKAARELDGKPLGLQFPPRLDLFVEELPEKSQAWLAEETKTVHIFRVLRRGKVADVFLALFFTAVWGLVALVSVVNQSGWPGALAVFYGGVALLATAPMVWAWRELAWSFAVPHRRMVSIHPLYMLEVGVEKLTAWPLVNFNDVRVVHQHTNGVYTTSNITLQFGKKKVSLAIKGQQLAVEFAQSLQGYRYRALQLLHGGLLEAEEGVDFIPVEYLEPGFRSKVKVEKRKARVKRWAASGAVALALAVAAAAVGAVREREAAWAAAVNTQSPAEMAKALERRPDSASAEALSRYRQLRVEAAKAALAATSREGSPERAAMMAVLDAVQRAERPMLYLRPKVLPLDGASGAGASAFSDGELKNALERSPQRLAQGFTQALTSSARDVVAVGLSSVDRGLTLEVAVEPELLPRSVQVGRTRWPLMGLKLTATLEGRPLAQTQVRLDAGDAAMLTSADTAQGVLDAQLQQLLFKGGEALAKSLGL